MGNSPSMMFDAGLMKVKNGWSEGGRSSGQGLEGQGPLSISLPYGEPKRLIAQGATQPRCLRLVAFNVIVQGCYRVR